MKTILFSVFLVGLLRGGKTTETDRFQLHKVIENLEALSANLTNAVTSYQPYRYDSNRFPMNFIKDGGHDLYDNGNMIRFVEGRTRHNLKYNATITTTRFNVTTLAINPFVALAAISNPEGEPHFYTFRVNGDLGADGKGRINTGKGQVAEGNGIANYYSFQVYESDDPSLCEVFFTITNKDFSSVVPSVFRVVRFSTSTRVTNNIVRVSGRPHNVYFGVIVLSRSDSELVPDNEIRDVMRIILKASSPVNDANTETSAVQQSTGVLPQVTSRPVTQQVTRFSTNTNKEFTIKTSTRTTTLEEDIPLNTSSQYLPKEDDANITLDEIVRRFHYISNDITSAIEEFYFYNYDTFRDPMNMIRDGGNDMYDSGNLVKFVEDNHMQHLMYNRTLRTERYDVATRSTHPFVTLAFIKNPDEEEHEYSIRVTGDIGADGEGNVSKTDGKLFDGNGFLKFYAFQVYNSGDPTICEVYFTITNTDWNSQAGDTFSVVMFSKTSRFLNNEVRLSGRPRNVVFGYTLFSRIDSAAIPDAEIIEAMKIILRSTITNDIQTGTKQMESTGSNTADAVTTPTQVPVTFPFETTPEYTTLTTTTFGVRVAFKAGS